MKLFFASALLLFILNSTQGSDWPTYGGPDRNHQSQEKTLRLDWGDSLLANTSSYYSDDLELSLLLGDQPVIGPI